MNRDIKELLTDVQEGSLSVEDACEMLNATLRAAPFVDLGFAKVDLHRKVRQGAAEVIYGASKTPEQIIAIANTLRENGPNARPILITRISAEAAATVQEALQPSFTYYAQARLGVLGKFPEPDAAGTIVVATGGTSDLPVAEEAALTAEALGNRVTRLFDVGVAGLHRLLSHLDELQAARVVIAVAGMEGALASVVGGLVDCPVIAVPTSVGYGTAFGGVAALLSMLNSCASGVSVVNIDNGFGAGFLASRINHI